MKIIPSILTDDIGRLTSMEAKAEGVVDRVQIDVIDNKFVDNSTVDPAVLKNMVTILKLDFHLIVKDPVEWVEHCVREGAASHEDRIIGQVEYMQSQEEFLNKVKAVGASGGLALDLMTPIEKLEQSLLKEVAVVLLMSVPAGFGGQEFDMSVWDKIEKMVKLRKELDLKFSICVDGGVTKELINQMKAIGVDEVTVGKRVFEGDLKHNLEGLTDG